MAGWESIIVTSCLDCPWGKRKEWLRDQNGNAPLHCCALNYPMSRLFEPEELVQPMLAPKWCRLRRTPVVYRLEENANMFATPTGRRVPLGPLGGKNEGVD